MSAGWDVEWGGWALGDLADVLRRIAGLLGPTQEVIEVTLAPPRAADAIPRVCVRLPDEVGIHRLRHEVTRGEYVVEFIGQARNERWTAEVAGVLLTVEVGDES